MIDQKVGCELHWCIIDINHVCISLNYYEICQNFVYVWLTRNGMGKCLGGVFWKLLLINTLRWGGKRLFIHVYQAQIWISRKDWNWSVWFDCRGMNQKFGGGRPPSGTPSLAWSCVVVIVSLLSGASVVHNIFKPNLVMFYVAPITCSIKCLTQFFSLPELPTLFETFFNLLTVFMINCMQTLPPVEPKEKQSDKWGIFLLSPNH